MKKYLVVIIFFLVSSCCINKSQRFEFESKYTSLYKFYKPGDTLFFSDKDKNLEKLKIISIDSITNCGGFLGIDRKQVLIKSQPVLESPDTQITSDLISIEKFPNNSSGEYVIGLRFKDFVGELKIDEKKQGSIIKNLQIIDYWIVPTLLPENMIHANSITSIIWTEKYGLTGYYKGNGEYYQLILK